MKVKFAYKWTEPDPKMAIVVLRKQTGFNQDFEFWFFGGKYRDLFFQSGFRDTVDFFKQIKQLTGRNQDSLPPTLEKIKLN